MSENNRRHTRHDVQIDVTLTLMEDDARAMQTRDLSEGGMFLKTATLPTSRWAKWFTLIT